MNNEISPGIKSEKSSTAPLIQVSNLEKRKGGNGFKMKVLLITCLRDGSWQIALLFLSKKGLLEAVDFKPYIKMINCAGKNRC